MVKKAAGGEQQVAFTRILHRTEPDILMGQVHQPAFRTAGMSCWQFICCDKHCILDCSTMYADMGYADMMYAGMVTILWCMLI